MISKIFPNNHRTLNWIYYSKELKPYVMIGNTRRFVPMDLSSLKQKLEEVVEKSLEPGQILLKDLPNSLRTNLKVFSKAYLGNHSVHNAINHFGFKTVKKKRVYLDDIANELKNAFSESDLRDYLKNRKPFFLRRELLKTESGRRAYNNKTVIFNNVSWKQLFNETYPDLANEFGDIYGLLTNSLDLNEKTVVDWLRNQFYLGKNISAEGLKKFPERQYLNFMLDNPLHQIKLGLEHEVFSKYKLSKSSRSYLRKTFSRRGSLFLTTKNVLTSKAISVLDNLIKEIKLKNVFVKKYNQIVQDLLLNEGKVKVEEIQQTLLIEHSDLVKNLYNSVMKKIYANHPSILVGAEPLTKNNLIVFDYLKKAIPEIKPYDVFPSRLMNSRIGRAGQGEVALVLELYRRAQSEGKNLFPPLEKILGSKIKTIKINDFNYKELKGGNHVVPDLELILENEKTVAVEIKRYIDFHNYEANRMVEKYSRLQTWPDGTKMDFKLNINMVPGALKNETKQFIEGNGWVVIAGEEYTKLFETTVADLKNNYHDEFHKTKLFLAGEKEEVFEKLDEMHDLIINKPHIMGRPTNFSKTTFIADFLVGAAQSLIEGEDYLTEERKKILQLKTINKWPIELFKKYYDIAQLQRLPKNHLFFDYETLSFLRQGGLVVVNSNLVREEEGVFVYTLLTRDPMEESKVAKKQIELIKENPFIFGFNSASFDVHYLKEMALANLLLLPTYKHLDLFHPWKPLAKENKYAHLKKRNKQGLALQVFEKYVLKNYDILRSEDIPGSEIPIIFENFFAGQGELESVQKSEIHCSFDSISTAFMCLHLVDKKRLFPRKLD